MSVLPTKGGFTRGQNHLSNWWRLETHFLESGQDKISVSEMLVVRRSAGGGSTGKSYVDECRRFWLQIEVKSDTETGQFLDEGTGKFPTGYQWFPKCASSRSVVGKSDFFPISAPSLDLQELDRTIFRFDQILKNYKMNSQPSSFSYSTRAATYPT